MNLRNLSSADIIGLGESQSLEFKRSGSHIKDAFADLCAMVNAKEGAGTVVFGIEPNGSAKVDAARLAEVTMQSKSEAATHWSTRKMAAELGVSAATVSRHWRKNGLKPHLVRGLKILRDPKFVEKLEDVVGLYMSLPEHAIVLR